MNTASSAGKSPARYSPLTPLTHTLTEACMWNSAPPLSAVTRSRCVSAPATTPLYLCACMNVYPDGIKTLAPDLTSPHLGGSETPARGAACVLLTASHWGQDLVAQTRAPSSISCVIEFHAAVVHSKHGPSVCEDGACLMQTATNSEHAAAALSAGQK